MTDTEQSTAETRTAAAKEIRRFLHGLQHVARLADDLEQLAGIEHTITEMQRRLAELTDHDSKWRTVVELEARLPELHALEGRIQALQKIADLEQAEAAVAASLTKGQNAEAALTERLAGLEAKCTAATATLADLDRQITEKRAALVEIERALGKWRARLAG